MQCSSTRPVFDATSAAARLATFTLPELDLMRHSPDTRPASAFDVSVRMSTDAACSTSTRPASLTTATRPTRPVTVTRPLDDPITRSAPTGIVTFNRLRASSTVTPRPERCTLRGHGTPCPRQLAPRCGGCRRQSEPSSAPLHSWHRRRTRRCRAQGAATNGTAHFSSGARVGFAPSERSVTLATEPRSARNHDRGRAVSFRPDVPAEPRDAGGVPDVTQEPATQLDSQGNDYLR